MAYFKNYDDKLSFFHQLQKNLNKKQNLTQCQWEVKAFNERIDLALEKYFNKHECIQCGRCFTGCLVCPKNRCRHCPFEKEWKMDCHFCHLEMPSVTSCRTIPWKLEKENFKYKVCNTCEYLVDTLAVIDEKQHGKNTVDDEFSDSDDDDYVSSGDEEEDWDEEDFTF